MAYVGVMSLDVEPDCLGLNPCSTMSSVTSDMFFHRSEPQYFISEITDGTRTHPIGLLQGLHELIFAERL